MSKLVFILFAIVLVSCSDDDKWFSPPDNLSLEIHNEINYYRLMSGRPAIEFSSYIEEQVFLHAQYLETVGNINYDNQTGRFEAIKSNLSVENCYEYVFLGDAKGAWLVEKLTESLSSEAVMLNATHFGVAAVKFDTEYFLVIIFAS